MLSQSSVRSGVKLGRERNALCSPIFDNRTGVNCEAFGCNDEWLTSEEAAAFLRISPATLRNLTSSGKVPFYKFGRRNRYRKSELVKMLFAEKRGVFL